jgi:hypothetical protein
VNDDRMNNGEINWKRLGKKWTWPNGGTSVAFAWRNWLKAPKPPVRIADVLTSTHTEHMCSRELTVETCSVWCYCLEHISANVAKISHQKYEYLTSNWTYGTIMITAYFTIRHHRYNYSSSNLSNYVYSAFCIFPSQHNNYPNIIRIHCV